MINHRSLYDIVVSFCMGWSTVDCPGTQRFIYIVNSRVLLVSAVFIIEPLRRGPSTMVCGLFNNVLQSQTHPGNVDQVKLSLSWESRVPQVLSRNHLNHLPW